MAIATALRPVDMDAGLIFPISDYNFSNTTVSVYGSASEMWRFNGTFYIGTDYYGYPTGLEGGIATSTAYNDGLGNVFSITGLNHNALTIYNYVLAYDDQGLLSYLFNGSDVMTGSSGDDVGHGYDGNDKIKGGGGDDLMTGDAGNDVLAGGGGADYLSGGAGGDRLAGGTGADLLVGGGGADRFVFDAVPKSKAADTIHDFTHAIDRLQLDDAVFNALAPGALAQDAFTLGSRAKDAEDRILYSPTDGRLYYDPDGTGVQAKVLVAILVNPSAAPTFEDFQVI